MIGTNYTDPEKLANSKKKFVPPVNDFIPEAPTPIGNSDLLKTPKPNPTVADLQVTEQTVPAAAPLPAFDAGTPDAGKGTNDAANGFMNKATAVVGLGANIYAQEQHTAANDEESVMTGINTTVQAAQVGMTVGGPVGAAVGAVGGIAYSVIKAKKDKKKRERLMNKIYNNDNKIRVAERERDQRMAEGQEQVNDMKALYQSQLGMINY